MSTRCNIIVKDQYGELIFYRHSDGYPKGAMPTLEKFLSYVKEDRIRDNVEQASGWLILLGHQEYVEAGYANPNPQSTGSGDGYGGKDWKIGAIEPATCIHGDIEYLYVIDLQSKTIHIDGQDGYAYKGTYNETLAA